jgi:NADH-quinone oxidoreductase subunit C
MVREQLTEKILQLVPEAQISENKQFPEFIIPLNQLYSLAKQLKEDESTCFDYLICQTGVDWPDKLSVIYHLTSTIHNHNLVLKVFISDREDPKADSVCELWRTAEYHEREIFDLLGIRFNNHPDMRRLFLDDTWKGYPLRKDYIDDINMIEFR